MTVTMMIARLAIVLSGEERIHSMDLPEALTVISEKLPTFSWIYNHNTIALAALQATYIRSGNGEKVTIEDTMYVFLRYMV